MFRTLPALAFLALLTRIRFDPIRSNSILKKSLRGALVGALAFGLLVSPTSSIAMAQRVGDYEMAFDAPWRMEPESLIQTSVDPGQPRAYTYGAIPIQLTVGDADSPDRFESQILQKLINAGQQGIGIGGLIWHLFRPLVSALTAPIRLLLDLSGLPHEFPASRVDDIPSMRLRDFRSVTIAEKAGVVYTPRAEYTINDLHEVELIDGKWRWAPDQNTADSGNSPPARPQHSLCRGWEGEDCSDMAELTGTSEWHATLMYDPVEQRTGEDVRLRITVEFGTIVDGRLATSRYSEFVSVHLGEAPLPRFDDQWIYGDLHYHSQGSDNDGEMGYSYRGTLQAMSALGMDFAMATDHTSNSPQIVSARPNLTSELVEPIFDGLRDMSPDRFSFGIDLLNGVGGGNREALSIVRPRTGSNAPLSVPQLFLGSEVDVIPEFGLTSGIAYNYVDACRQISPILKAASFINDASGFFAYLGDSLLSGAELEMQLDALSMCDGFDMTDDVGGERYLIRDVQGPASGKLFSDEFYGRQHLIHFPDDPQRRDAVVLANTSKYGGATRRLRDVLDQDLARDRKGVAFMAHPFSRATGDDIGRMGPDIVSFSDAQLEDAFASPDILGLQIWNGNGQLSTSMHDGDARDFGGRMVPVADLDNWRHSSQNKKSISDDVAQWDRMLLWGIDPDRTAQIDWLAAGEPRRFFMAGGSDAHGDFNYRREGYFRGNSEITDTALGTPRNLVFAGRPEGQRVAGAAGSATPHSQQQVVEALRDGNFSVTDGPAVRIVFDQNRNGVIDNSDTPMGGVASVRGCNIPILVEWLSTPEFGRVEKIDLVLGLSSDSHNREMIYEAARELPPEHMAMTWTDLDGKIYYQRGQYWTDPSLSTLAIDVASGEEYAGMRRVVLDPAEFPVGMSRLVCDEELEDLQAAHDAAEAGDSLMMTTLSSPVSISSQLTSSATIAASFSSTGWTFDGGGTGTGDSREVDIAERVNTGYTPTTISPDLEVGPGGGGGFPWEDGPPDEPPLCENSLFDKPVTADRLFVRAVVHNSLAPNTNRNCGVAAGNQCVHRKAYSNPVWFNYEDVEVPILTCLAVTAGSSDLDEASIDESPTSDPGPATGPVAQGSFDVETEGSSRETMTTEVVVGDREANTRFEFRR